jgi:hypothetical protein
MLAKRGFVVAATANRDSLAHRLGTVACAVWLALAPTPADADAVVGAFDDFTLLHSWQGNTEFQQCGSCSFPPFLCLCPPASQQQGVSTQLGGPDGLLDSYLRVSELPSYGVETWNHAEDRTGNYLAAGIGVIELDVRNFGPGQLAVRVGIERDGTQWVTSDADSVVLPPASGWLASGFELSPAQMTRVAGSGTLAFVLGDVQEIRLLHAESPQWSGDGGATLGIDNVLLPEPGDRGLLLCGAGLLALLAARRDRRQRYERPAAAAARLSAAKRSSRRSGFGT